MRRRWWKWLFVLVPIPALVWGCDRAGTIHWVGATDLEIEFVVTDGASGQPVAGAQIDVDSRGGFYDKSAEEQFQLTADADGKARRVCRNAMCFGTRSGLGFTDTFVVHLPWWRFRASAPGFRTGEWQELDVPEYGRQVQRVKPGRSRLLVPV